MASSGLFCPALKTHFTASGSGWADILYIYTYIIYKIDFYIFLVSSTLVSYCGRKQCKMYVQCIVKHSVSSYSVLVRPVRNAKLLFSIFCIMLCCCHRMLIIFKEWNREGEKKTQHTASSMPAFARDIVQRS